MKIVTKIDIIKGLMAFVIGATLATTEVSFARWQFWIILLAMCIACWASEIKQSKKQ